jgi:CRISPR-associated endonuclease/helicase Cas3
MQGTPFVPAWWEVDVFGHPTSFWGKLRREADRGPVLEWHPLADHCADVAAVVEALLSLPIWRERLARLARQELTEVTCARLCALAALHDIGKLNIGFQAKGRPELLDTTAGHVTEALGAFLRRPGPLSSLDELAGWGDATTSLLVSALCHHGRPYNADVVGDSTWQATWWTPRAGLNPCVGAEDLLRQCRTWFPRAFEVDDSALPDAPAFSHAFAGLVMLADWMGSDTRFFPFGEKEDCDRMSFARGRSIEAIAAMALDVPVGIRADTSGRNSFDRIAPPGYVARSAQAAMLGLSLDENGSITILEAETGSGKTEAVLARFVTLFEAGLVDGLYFALPTRTAATQMYGRVHKAAQRAFATPPAVVLAVPGYLRVDNVEGRRHDADGRKLPPFEVLWPDHGRLRYRAWAAENPKRYLTGCIVVGTIDQVLLSSLMVGHAHLRASSLLRHLLVVDEVHASDAYMTRILEDVLARHRSAGGHAILLSATLGGETRTRLLHAGKRATAPRFDESQVTPYPLITHFDEVEQTIAVGADGPSRVVRMEVLPSLGDPERVAAEALAAGVRGAKVLVIRNTVNDCIGTQIALERLAEAQGRRDVLFSCDGVAAPHHALFARPDREALDRQLESRIGKDRSDGGCIVIATQTVQQSLDLDADIMISDICPADVLLQRLGRLHRHERARPSGFESARALVIVPECRDLGVLINESGVARNHHGLGRVYPDLRILEATWRLLEREAEWRIPAMNRQLVENSVHSTVLAAIAAEGGTRWQAHSNQAIGAIRGQQRQADLNLVDWSKPYSEMSFPTDERIATRLGEGDRLVHFTPPVRGPFGLSVNELTLRSWWVRGVPSDVESAEGATTAKGVTSFCFGGTSFVYDRLGLRPDKSRTSEVAEDDGP